MSQYVSLYRQTLARRQLQYDNSIAAGESTPFIYPWDSCFALCLLLGVALIPKLPLRIRKLARYSAFTAVSLHSWYVVTHRRTLWFGGGYGIGLSTVWGTIMSGTVFLFNDVGHDYWRLEAERIPEDKLSPHSNGSVPRCITSGQTRLVDLRKRKVPGIYTANNIEQDGFDGSDCPSTEPYKLIWRGFPHQSSWVHVIDWTVDLVTAFRGVNWSHRIPTLLDIDAPIPPKPKSGSGARYWEGNSQSQPTAISRQTLRALQYQAVQDFIFSYFVLDFLKTTMITDPYFLGLESLESPTPWSWLAQLNETVPVATRIVRLAISMIGVVSALTFIFSLNPLFFTIILPALVDISKITRSPLLEPWLYPPQWYPLSTSVLQTGLAGFWGKFWHQMFRYGISEPSRVLIQRLGLNQRGNGARMIQLLIAFGLSGSIHAAGSFTTFSLRQTYPLSGPLMFFLMQAVGVFLQTLVVKFLHDRVPSIRSLPRPVRQATNLIATLTFLYFTGPLLANDFARCGLWLFEPVPISLLRGLGFGPGGEDEGFWAWHQRGSKWIGWWMGQHWWETGLAIY